MKFNSHNYGFVSRSMNAHTKKKKATLLGGFSFWWRLRDSNL